MLFFSLFAVNSKQDMRKSNGHPHTGSSSFRNADRHNIVIRKEKNRRAENGFILSFNRKATIMKDCESQLL